MKILPDKDVFGFDKQPLPQPPVKKPKDTYSNPADVWDAEEFPPLIVRIKALFIDLIIIIIISIISTYLIDLFGGAPNWVRGVILIALILLYEPCLVSFKGGTVGHHLLAVRVRNIYKPKENIWLLAAFFRFFVKSWLGWISFLTVTSNKRKRAIHDFCSGSIMIYKK